jgi:hypothetical protein
LFLPEEFVVLRTAESGSQAFDIAWLSTVGATLYLGETAIFVVFRDRDGAINA